jgi:ACS family glucarate transporter-like MFS transporter
MNRRYLIYGLLFFLTVLNYFHRVVLSIAMPSLSLEYGLDPAAQGWLLSSFLWSYVLLLIPGGVLLDRWGTRRLTAAAVGFWSLATAAAALPFGYIFLIFTRVMVGVGMAPTFPASVRAVREWAPMRERAWATAFFQAGPAFGTATSAVIVGWMISMAGWRTAFAASGALGVIWVVVWLIFFRQPAEARWLGEPERRMILAERSPGGTAGRGLSMTDLVRYRTMWGLFIAQGCINYTQYLALTWLPSYLVRSRGLNLMSSGVDLAIIYLGACAVTLLAARVSDAMLTEQAVRQGKRRNMVAFFCVVSSVMLIVPFMTSTWALVLALMLSLAGVQSALTNTYSLISDVVRDGGGIGKAVGWLQLGGNTFGIVAPIATGYIIAITGSYTSAFVSAGVLLLIGAVVALTMTRQPVGEIAIASGHDLSAVSGVAP